MLRNPEGCFNTTCKCKKMEIVREVLLKCKNCHCGVKVQSTKMDLSKEDLESIPAFWRQFELQFDTEQNRVCNFVPFVATLDQQNT